MTRSDACTPQAVATFVAAAGLCLALGAVSPAPLPAQTPAPSPALPPADSADLRGDLEHAVDTYERSRRRYAPTDWFARTGGRCDQYVGRMCLTLGEGADWWFPDEIPERMEEERARLLGTLVAGRESLPGDGWVLGQLVRYLGEGGEWDSALLFLDPCSRVGESWCAALRGLALHGSGRYVEAEAAFGEALARMPPERRRAWSDPGDVVDDDLREHLDTLRGPALDRAVERFWRLSDPFLLVPGNDRWTEHLARRTMNEIRYGGDSAYRIRFRDDLEEVTLRYGWEVGWERRPASVTSVQSETSVVGHQHPYSLPWVAPEPAVLDPAGSNARDWTPQSERIPRTGYAPLYAPNVLPDGEVLVFPRGREAIVAASIALPADTSWHADHGHPPLPVPPAFAGSPATSGLFAMDVDGHPAGEDRRTFPVLLGAEREEIADLLPPPTWHELRLSAGDWVVSVEHVVPDLGRGARLRRGLRVEERLLDEPTLSDLLLLPATPEPATLEAALDGVALRSARPGARLRVGWETWGLGREREGFSYRLTLTEAGGGIVDRVAGWLGLGGDDVVSDLEWTELGPERLGAHFRTIELALPPDLDAGRYRLRLELVTPGRNPLVSERDLVVRP